MKKLDTIKAEEGTVKAVVLADAKDQGDEAEAINYIKDVAEHGCSGGSCTGLIYYSDIYKFYNDYAGDIDNILERLGEEIGEAYNITDNMTRLKQTDLRNFLTWLAYEVEAQDIIRELDPEY